MLGTWTLGLGTAVNFCKEAEQAAEQGGGGLSQELAFMLNPCDKRLQSVRSITLPFEVSGWDPLHGLSRQACNPINMSIWWKSQSHALPQEAC